VLGVYEGVHLTYNALSNGMPVTSFDLGFQAYVFVNFFV